MTYAVLTVRLVPKDAVPLVDDTGKPPAAGTQLEPSAAGHLWVSLEKPGEPTLSFGFYPVEKDPFRFLTGIPGYISTHDNAKYPSAQSWSFSVNDVQFNAALEFCRMCQTDKAFGEWALVTHSCVDFAYAVLRQAGIPIAASSAGLVDVEGIVLPEPNGSLLDLTRVAYVNSGNAYAFNSGVDVSIAALRLASGLVPEDIRGSYVADVISGGGGVDRIFGFSGNDVIEGGAGADELFGGAGDDWLGYTAPGLIRSTCF